MKLPPHEFAALVNDLQVTAKQFHDAQQLREQIVKTLNRGGVFPDHPHLRMKGNRKKP